MSRTLIAFHAADMSAMARALRKQLALREDLPSHLELLNMLARAAGHRNFQDIRAAAPIAPPEAHEAFGAAAPDEHRTANPDREEARARLKDQVTRLLRCFDEQGRLLRWPSRRTDQINALWILWSHIPAHIDLTEREVNERLKSLNAFEDHAILRRELCGLGLMRRTPDGRVYRRIEQPLPDIIRQALRRMG